MADDTELTPQVEHERFAIDSGSEGIGRDWPPDWMVTYSDMTTILMTFFVLWYSLTVAGIDEDLLKMREQDDADIVRGMAEESQMDFVTEEEYRILTQFQLLPREQQETVLSELGTLRLKAEEVMEFVRMGRMEGDVELKVTAEDIVIIPTAPLVFREGRAEIRETFYPILDKIAWLIEETGASVRIEGHTDSTPIHPRHRQRFPSNWELSATRAIAVANYFIDRGDIPPEQISAAAYGPSRPKYPDDDPELRGRNRRVEFHIYLGSETAGS
ncbi:MAG: flagellar motor protein MotB [Candidatus Erginobacter occultus]|nr:flagellar motor protein MotB [Candidatus Erginobacter occultus]